LANRLQHGVRGAAAVVCLALGVLPCEPVVAQDAQALAGARPEAPREPAAPATPAASNAASRPGVPTRPAANEGGLSPADRLARAFAERSPDEPLEDRVDRARAEASRMGMWSAEPAARGLLLAAHLGREADRARAATRLAPGLPAAWSALALSEPGVGSGPALWRALFEMERNLDASVWWRANAWYVLAWGLVVGGLLFLVASAVRMAPAAAHDLGHRLPGGLPPHAWAALLACVGVLPAVLGEGLVGLAAGALGVAFPWAAPRHRAALCSAFFAVMVAVHPLTAETGRWVAALHADPATLAIRDAEVGSLTPSQRERLVNAAPRDPAASHALALWSKRTERLDEAWHWLELAEASDSSTPVLLNDAANVRLAMGDPDGALRLYEAAAEHGGDAAVLFNLAQAYGSRIALSHQEAALNAAHAVSAATVRELAELRGNDRLAVDVAWPVSDLRHRLVRTADGRAIAAALRTPFGTGRLVDDPWLTPLILLGSTIVGIALGRGRNESRLCGACRARRCDACAPSRPIGCTVCEAAGSAPPWLGSLVGLGRPAALRVVPGLAALSVGKPFLGWTAALGAATAGAAFTLRHGVVADPLVVGHAGPIAFVGIALLLAGVWAAATWWPLRGPR